MKRTRRGATSVSSSAPPGELTDDHPEWQAYLSEEMLNQWNKLGHGGLHMAALQDGFAETLLSNWYYQYVVTWLYKVCDSFVTMSYAEEIENGNFKPLWKDLKFDEFFLLEDLRAVAKSGMVKDYHDEDESIYMAIRLRLLGQLTNNKGISLKDWDTAVNHHLSQSSQFKYLSLEEQFEVIYLIVKIIETKNLAFRNYLSNNLGLFEIFEYVIDENKTLLVLPNVGVTVEKAVVRNPAEESLNVPVKLENCTIKYWDEKSQVLELVHLDYSNEISDYLKSFKIEYKVITNDWNSFLEHFSQDNSVLELSEWIPIYVEHQLYIGRLIAQREKEKSMAELLVRRKRSSRLVAREEETKKKELENSWYEKLDEREHFIKTRNKAVTKQLKRIKDYLWNRLWQNFEQDLKEEKLKRRHEQTPTNPAVDEELSELDEFVIEKGTRFNQRILAVVTENATEMPPPTELPEYLCIHQEELDELANYGISTNNEQPDDQSWCFQCPGEPEIPPIKISNAEQEESLSETYNNLFGKAIVCCDMCLKWQHWDCNHTEDYQELLAALLGHQTTIKDFAPVQLGNYAGNRRSSRKQQQDHIEAEYTRPIDKRKPASDTKVFICRSCTSHAETDLRLQFAPELKAIKLNQRRQAEERERKRILKEQKKKLQEMEHLQRLQQLQQLPEQPSSLPSL